MVVLDLDENNNAEVVFTKELIQNKEDLDDSLDLVGKFSIQIQAQAFLGQPVYSSITDIYIGINFP